MSRIYDEKVPIDESQVRDFFERRGSTVSPDHPLTSVLYQDEHPEIAEGRDRHEKETILPLLGLNAHAELLDVGCGIGRWAEPLAGSIRRYHGVDFSQSLLRVARSRIRQTNFTFQQLAAEDVIPESLSVPADFTHVIIAGLLLYLNDEVLKKTMEGIARCCGPACTVYLREPVAIASRLTLQNFHSEELNNNYNAIYRTQSQLEDSAINYLVTRGFLVLRSERLYPVSLQNRKDTRQIYYILRRSSD